MAMGGSNQSIFIITVLLAGQGDIHGQWSAAVPLLIIGLLLSWAAAPGWIELILMYPNRIGGIAATCGEAFKPYSPILANLTGVCYWWGWIPTCGLTAIFSATALHDWGHLHIPVQWIASVIVLAFVGVNLCGVKWAARLAIVFAAFSAGLAFLSALGPVLTGAVNWKQAVDFHLTTPFPGWFGAVTSAMAGLYLIGFAAPASGCSVPWNMLNMMNPMAAALAPLPRIAKVGPSWSMSGSVPSFPGPRTPSQMIGRMMK